MKGDNSEGDGSGIDVVGRKNEVLCWESTQSHGIGVSTDLLYVIRKLATCFLCCLYFTKYQKSYIIGKLENRLIELIFF